MILTRKHAVVAALVAIILIIPAVLVLRNVGGPKSMQLSADDRRVQDVLDLTGRIVTYTDSKGRFPLNLSDLREDGSEVPVDPVTSKPYFYEILGHDSIRLCAVFSSANYFEVGGGYRGDYFEGVWEHGAGRQCLDKNVRKIIGHRNQIKAEVERGQGHP